MLAFIIPNIKTTRFQFGNKPLFYAIIGFLYRIPFFVLNLTFCFGVCGFLLWYHGFCKKLKIPNEKDNVYTRIVLSTNEAKRLECENSVKNGRLNNQSPSVTAPTSPLLLNPRMNILILYSHDSTAHEEAVTALAEYLRDVFNLQISVSPDSKNQK